jgi:hypothetical protein
MSEEGGLRFHGKLDIPEPIYKIDMINNTMSAWQAHISE